MSQTILITGANRGIGLALSRQLLDLGHHVLATARRPDAAKALHALKSDRLTILAMNITSDDSVATAVKAAGEKIDILVNNAGLFPEDGTETLDAIDLQHFRDAFEVNVIGAVRVTRAFRPLLEKGERPRVVNISSGAGSISRKRDHKHYAYSTSKAALNMATRAMAAELKERGICVVAVTPGWVQTDMGGDKAPLTPEESATAIAKTVLGLDLAQAGKFLERTGAESSFAW